MSDHPHVALANVATGLAISNSILSWLPPVVTIIAGVAATILYGLEIYEKPTVQAWLKNRRSRPE